MYKVDQNLCKGCQDCIKSCPSDAISMVNNKAQINPDLCQECGICVDICPENAIYNETKSDYMSRENNLSSQNPKNINPTGKRKIGRGQGRGLNRGQGRKKREGSRDGRGRRNNMNNNGK